MKKLSFLFLLFVGITISSLGQLSKFITLSDFDSTYSVVSQTMNMDDRLISILFEKDSIQYSLMFDDIGNLTGYQETNLMMEENLSMSWYDGYTLNEISYVSKDSNYVMTHGVDDYQGLIYNVVCSRDTCVTDFYDYEGNLFSKEIYKAPSYDLLYSYHPNGRLQSVDTLHLKEYMFISYYDDGTIEIEGRKSTEYYGFIGEFKSYYPNGKLQSKGRYEVNLEGYFTEPKGKWYYYREDGTVEERVE